MNDPRAGADAAAGMRRTPPTATRLQYAIVLLLLVLVVWRLVLPALREENFGLALDAKRGGWSSDFAAHLAFAEAFWTARAGYDVQSHLRITSERFGRPLQRALPFGYSPTMLWILGPLCVFPAAWAYGLWSLFGVGAAWWMTSPRWSLWTAAALFSPAAFTCFKLGQTSLLTAAGLLFLMSRDLRGHATAGRPKSDWLDGIVLWTLTAKPPLALTASVVLLAGHRWRPVALALAIGLLSAAMLTPWLGTHWMRDYLHLITHYDRQTADPAFVWSLVPETMGNLRALLHVTFGVGDSAASRWSSALWVLALFSIIAAGRLRRISAAARWGFAVLAYLLLCPHVTSTEELHLVLLLALTAGTIQPAARPVRWSTAASVLAVLYLPPGLGYQGTLRIPAVLAAKVLLAGLVWAQWPPSPPTGQLRSERGSCGSEAGASPRIGSVQSR